MKYVDLKLPSGTLWSFEDIKVKDYINFTTQAKHWEKIGMLPTIEQYVELLTWSRKNNLDLSKYIEFDFRYRYCILNNLGTSSKWASLDISSATLYINKHADVSYAAYTWVIPDLCKFVKYGIN